MDLQAIQAALRDAGVDGWLFHDFLGRDPLSYRILGLPEGHAKRRWYYYIPASGEPRRLVHAVEAARLDPLPGAKTVYRSWQELHGALRELMRDLRRVAMQYSPLDHIPYVSTVDAGTVDLVRNCGVEVVSSADLVQQFEALVSAAGFATHEEAGRRIHRTLQQTFDEIATRVRKGETYTEYEAQQAILRRFRLEGLTSDGDGPIVAVRGHAADPHFEPTPAKAVPIRRGDTLLLDLWARLDQPDAIYYDITWCAYLGGVVPEFYDELFRVATGARDAAVAFVRERMAAGAPLFGYEIDDVSRGHVVAAGYGEAFVHRTGHSIGTAVHGNGVNIDNLETQDRRRVVPGCLFSVEPGIYLPDRDIGVRTELDVYVNQAGEAVVSGPIQHELVLLD
jgi:Xaa-Pro aminopeptidase